MKTKAFTLLELMMAVVLGMLVMLGSVGVLENMQKQSAGFQSRITADMNWVEANRHLAQMVRPSSYLELSDSVGGTPEQFSTLTLRDYDGNVRGRYTNTPAALTYIDDTTGVGNRTGNNPLSNVNATFSAVATTANPAKGTKFGRLVEVAVNYTAPFANTLRLRCATAVERDEMWSVLFPSGDTPPGQVGFLGCSIQQTPLVDYVFTARNPDVHAVKLSRYGDRIWARNLNRHAEDYSAPVQVNGDEYMIAARTAGTVPNTTGDGIWLVRTGSDGMPTGPCAWTREFNVGGSTLRPVNILRNTNGDYIVLGIRTLINSIDPTDFYVAKVTSIGNLVWERSYGVAGPSLSISNVLSITQASGGGYIIAGAINSLGVPYPHIIKIAENGAPGWSKTFTNFISGPQTDSYNDCHAVSIIQTSAGSYTMLISGSYPNMSSRFYLVRIISDGTSAGTAIQWSRKYENPSDSTGGCFASSFQAVSGGFIIAGTIFPAPGVSGPAWTKAIYLLRTNSTGNPGPFWPLWPKIFSPGVSSIATSVWQNTDGSYIIAGSAETTPLHYKAYIIKTDTNGDCPKASNPTDISL